MCCFFFSSRRRHTRCYRDWSSDVCSSDLDGVFFVSLGEVKVASLVAPELAKALATVETGPNLEALLIRRLAGSKALIVLDTFEHLTPAAPLVYALLLGCPEA